MQTNVGCKTHLQKHFQIHVFKVTCVTR
jgi:hypothetical protein